MSDLNEIISDSLQDATQPELEFEASEANGEANASSEANSEAGSGDASNASEETAEVDSPAARAAEAEPADEDEFAKKHGIPQPVAGERENRIPYSRVKKITSNAVKEATEPLSKQVTELSTKVSDYESRLENVGKFEYVMMNEPQKFLQMLNQIPAYAQFFNTLAAQLEQTQGPAAPPPDPNADMPQPNKKLEDGSLVYDLEGLKALNEWNRKKAREEALQEVQQTYGPIQEQWQAQQRVQALVPQVQRQIDEARTWESFTENEAEIVKALEANRNLSLEGAYRQVVFPKFKTAAEQAKTDRAALKAETRKEVLAELKRAPTATSVGTSASKPGAPARTGGTQRLEDIILNSIQDLPGR